MIKEKEYLKKEDLLKIDKEEKLIPITFDYMFKGIFMNDLDLLKEFIISQLEFNFDLKECKIRLLNNELPKENKNEYKKTIDLYVSIDNKVFVEIEINRELFKDVKMRNYLYGNKLYTMLLEQGEDAKTLNDKTFIQINLNVKDVNIDKGDAFIVPYDIRNKEVYIKNSITILKYLEYYRKKFYNDNNLSNSDMWLVMLTSETFEELYELTGYIMNDEERDKYIRKVIGMSKDNFILHEWEKEKLEQLVEAERRRNALAEGFEEGVEEGIEQNKLEVVINMLNENLNMELISKVTGLSEKEIIKIKETL